MVIRSQRTERTGLVKVGWGVKGIGSGQSRVRAAKVRVAKGQGGKCARGLRPGGQRARSAKSESPLF